MAATNVSLSLIGWTYTNSNIPNTNYANKSPLLAYGSQSQFGECRTILQFDVNSEISASKINSAVLNYSVQIATNAGTGKDGKLYFSSAYTHGYIYNSVTHNNYSSMVTQGVRILKSDVSFSSTSFISNQVEVTSAVANNINDGVLTLVIEGYAGWPLQINPNTISLVLNYEKPAEVLPVPPVITAPNGTYENRQSVIKFQWIYKSQTQATQASVSLEYRNSTSGAYTTININNANNFYDMPSNSFNEGVCEWRIRTTDTDNKTSEYAYGSFTVIDRPSVPIITNIENKCISTITWSSANQTAFEFEVYKGNDVEFSKKISSSANNYKPNIFFANTAYTIRLRVCNSYGLWSEWGSKIYTFTFTNPTKPSIIVSPKNSDIIIRTDTEGSILYKSSDNINFTPIYKFTDTKEYRDYNIADDKKYKYFVRKYDAGYADSDNQVAQVSINGIILQNDEFCVNAVKSSDTYMNFTESLSVDKVINYYTGRVFGVLESGEHQDRAITRDILIDESQYGTLKQLYLSAMPVIYRDNKGNLFRCDLGKPSFKNAVLNTKYSISVTVKQIDYTEEINIYD